MTVKRVGDLDPLPPAWYMDPKEYPLLQNLSTDQLIEIVKAVSKHNFACHEMRIALTERINGIINMP